ncbi:MAG: TonB-dependent receptor [Calditrichia bacterium]
MKICLKQKAKSTAICIAILCLISIPMKAQEILIPVKGKLLTENGEAVMFANIFVEGTSLGTMSDEKGAFEIFLPKDDLTKNLIVSYIGYEEIMIRLSDQKDLTGIVLKLGDEKSIRNENVFVYGKRPVLKTRGVEKDFMSLLVTEADGADIIEASSKMPGSQKKDNDSRIYLRGGEFYETRFISDGAYLLNPYLTNTGFGAIGSYIDATDASTYLFSSGGFSSRYTGALSGIVEIKSSNFREGWSSMTVAALPEGLVLHREMPLSKRVGFAFSAFAFDQDSYFQANKSLFSVAEELDVFSDHPKGFTTKGRINADLGVAGHLKASAAIAQTDYVYKIRVVGNRIDLASTENHRHFNMLYTNFFSTKLGVESNVALTNYDTESLLSETNWRNSSTFFQWNTIGNYYFDESRDLQFGMNLHALDLQTERYFLDEGQADFRPDLASGRNHIIPQSGIFADYKWQFKDKLGVNMGARTELHGESVVFDPRASAFYRKTNWIYKLSVGRYSQLPQSRYYAAISDVNLLKPERSTHLMLDAEYEDPTRKLYAGMYYKRYSDLVLNQGDSFSSTGDGEAIGADLRINIKTRLLSKRIQYSFTTSLLSIKKRFRQYQTRVAAPTDVPMSNYFFFKYYFTGNTHLGFIHYQSVGRPYSTSDEQLQNRRLPWSHSTSIYGLIKNNVSDWDLYTYISLSNIFGVKNIYGYSFSEDYTSRIPQYTGGIRSLTIAVSLSK